MEIWISGDWLSFSSMLLSFFRLHLRPSFVFRYQMNAVIDHIKPHLKKKSLFALISGAIRFSALVSPCTRLHRPHSGLICSSGCGSAAMRDPISMMSTGRSVRLIACTSTRVNGFLLWISSSLES